ncbi:enoyl-CoA hydratase/isomerase family protein [Nonomuraea typhae]|uniref:enoyl-CoA hydratase/isomerase family protein n=1 Tax=Nonomuraea typhae TaxID=2603600 RepID=UPI0012FAB064|nr:enoyl-CoA hydratase/isomerase family protein [Nonomuraea typhae]
MIEVNAHGEVTVITLNRPDKLNALTSDMRVRLAAAVREHGHSGRGIVVTGAGRAFCAGEDLYEAAGTSLTAEVETFHDLTRAVLETTVPVVAAVNGLAVGGAAEWILSFDARLGTPAAGYFFPENGIGLSISNASSVLLPRLTGGRALRLVLDTARLDAAQALTAGLLDEVVPGDALLESAVALAERWTEPGLATAVHLRLLRPSLEEVERAFARESAAAHEVEETGLAKAGMQRFATRARR